ncbi:MAG: ATP-binding protein [Candidatus Cohnella colombiensis]|uniref:histidine kinase n=1 Tax=Candidatus Cohnella colombiensis TaxID=3121368 RepID=A0AA95EU43_9BACL|nr:MAG: ATP-binding protein [Cohnella sp.]
MLQKWIHSIRMKFLGFSLLSAGITAAFLYSGYALGGVILSNPSINDPVAFLVNRFGSIPVAIIMGVSVYILSFFLLSRGTIRRIEALERTVVRIREGKFDNDQPDQEFKDEIAQLSTSIHEMSNVLSDDLRHILDGLQHVAIGRLDQPIDAVERSGELAEVAMSINRMAEQLQRTITDERNAEKSKNDLITGVSHDLRTPLTSILGFLEVIHEDRYRDEVELRHYLTIVYDKALTLKKLIDDLFEYTRVNNGMPLQLTPIDIVGFIHQLAEEFVPQLEGANMICRVHAIDESLIVSVDGDLLVRSFENLISNAIRYGREGRYVDINVHSKSGIAHITVTNYGAPIPERDIPFLFDRFYRSDTSRSKDTGGTGLGLAITKSIIERHDGTITVSSHHEQTQFMVSLPIEV